MHYVKEEDGWIFAECLECGQTMKFRKCELRLDKASRLYRLQEEVQCFCEEESDFIADVPVPQDETLHYVSQPTLTPIIQRNVPKCPTCGSDKVTKISVGAKVAGGAMFGIFSSNIRKSYKCNNCGYKW